MTGIFIGYPKCGSTTIQQWLNAHPQITYLPQGDKGEAGETRAQTVIGDEGLSIPFPAYAQLNQSDVDAVIGEMRDGLALRAAQIEVCQNLAAKYPPAKVLMVTRGAAGFMRSIYLNYVKFGGTRSFEQYAGECEPYFRTWLDYDFLVGLYQQHFGPAQVLTLPAELLFANPTQFWQMAGEFWQVEPHPQGAPAALNQALYDSSAPLARRLSAGVKVALRPLPAAWRKAVWRRYAYSFLPSGALSPLEKLTKKDTAKDAEPSAFAAWQTTEKLAQTDIYYPFRHLYTAQPEPAAPRPIFPEAALQAKLSSDGYVIIDFFAPEEVARLQEYAAGMLQSWDGAGIFTSINEAGREGNHEFDALIRSLASDKIRALTNACYLHGATFLIKGTSGETIFPMHQDWNNVDETRFMTYALWIPLTDTDGANGGLCVVPQSHKIFPRAIRTPAKSLSLPFVDQSTPHIKPLQVKAGQAVIYHHSLIHGSRYNTTGTLRPVIHAGIFPREAQHLHYFINGATVEELLVDSELFYQQFASILAGHRPAGWRVNKTFPLLPEHTLNPEDFYREMEKQCSPDAKANYHQV